jgi:hypothetical protein
MSKDVVYDKLFVYDDAYPKINRSTQVFTREMGIACAKRLMSKYPEDPSLGYSNRWEFNPIQYEVLVRAPFLQFVRVRPYPTWFTSPHNEVINGLVLHA